MRNLLLTAAALSSIVLTTPSLAREWADAGGWTIFEDDETACTMASEFTGDGDTRLSILLYIDDLVYIGLTNSQWTAEKGKEYPLSYHVNGYTFDKAPSTGIRLDYRQGFIRPFNIEIIDHIVKGNGLLIKMGDKTVDNLTLSGSAAGVAQLRRCVASLKARKAKADAEQRAFSYIDKDPFAKKPGVGQDKPAPTPSEPR